MLPTKAPSGRLVDQTVYSWAGNYFGVNVGAAPGTYSFSPSASPALGGLATAYSDATSANNTDVIGGIQIGRRWQFGQWVLGFEQMIQFTNLTGSITAGPTVAPPFATGDNFTAKVQNLNSSRLKVGYAWDRVLVYGAAGLESGVIDVTGNYASRGGLGAGAPLSFSDSHKFQVGYNVGVGVEYAVTNRVSFGVEYNYLTLNKATYNLGTVASAAGVVSNVTSDVDLHSSEILARLNVKFNGFGLLP
jgi:outer membrane immunogenic protein